jgi:DNA-binding NarL/FixJ family response regulator
MLLVARGLTNGEIADRLVSARRRSRRTVSRILSKLDLRDRVQIVVVAYEAGLIRPRRGRARASD